MANISVIIPCYNVEKYIDRCLTSVTKQTIGMDSLEIICIDDASTDGTWEKLQKWYEQYPEHILALHLEKNSRQGTARNIGLEYATAPWISYIDSDDWVELDYLEKLYNITTQRDCDVVMCQHGRDTSTTLSFFEDTSTDKESRMLRIDTVERRKQFIFLNSANSYAWGKLIRKTLLTENAIYFPEDLAYEDILWGTLMHMYIEHLYILEERLYHYYANESSTVLKRNEDHHVDFITVQMKLWNELQNRGFFRLYAQELEYNFLISCYLGFLKVIVRRYENPSYSLFMLLKEFVLERVPDYKANYYIAQNILPPNQSILLEALNLPLSKEDFKAFAGQIEAIGI